MWYVLGFKKIKENLRTLSRIPIGTIASTLTVSQWDDVYMDVMAMKFVKRIVWLDLRIGSSIVLVRWIHKLVHKTCITYRSGNYRFRQTASADVHVKTTVKKPLQRRQRPRQLRPHHLCQMPFWFWIKKIPLTNQWLLTLTVSWFWKCDFDCTW